MKIIEMKKKKLFEHSENMRMEPLTGIDADTAITISFESKLNAQHAYAAFCFMKNGGYYYATSVTMSHAYPLGGWCETNTKARIPVALHAIARLRDKYLFPHAIFTKHYDTKGLLDDDTQFAIDTVPCSSIDSARYMTTDEEGKLRGNFNPKYGEAVQKMFVAIHLRGFIVHASGPQPGSESDASIYQQSGFDGILKGLKKTALGDGAFPLQRKAATDEGETATNLKKCVTKGGIWPKHLAPGQTRGQYLAAGHRIMTANAAHCHFRGRIEHLFAAPMINRWLLFQNFRHEAVGLLENAFVAACIAINIAMLTKFDSDGRYAEIEDEQVDDLREHFDAHLQQLHRYPVPRRALESSDDEGEEEEDDEGDASDEEESGGNDNKNNCSDNNNPRQWRQTQLEQYFTKRKM
jgi:hypothetical protein